jgi:hypothetical protein
MIFFPDIAPTEREFILGSYSIVKPEFKSLARFARIGGTAQTDLRMILDFANITDQEAVSILVCYANSMSGFLPIQLSQSLFAGLRNSSLEEAVQGRGRVQWYFFEKPVIEAVITGYSSARVAFRGVI